MRVAVTGGTGLVGRFLVAAALGAGHRVTLLGRRPPPPGLFPAADHRPWALGEAPDLAGTDLLLHAAFAHLPGRYRGGEGDDPAGFRAANRDGALALFEAARRAGARVLLLSSRAVFDGHPPGTRLTEDLPPRPDSLYGEVKAELEAALLAGAAGPAPAVVLRATGVYGVPPGGGPGKWGPLFAALREGREIAPRVATEVHGADLAQAALLLLNDPAAPAGSAAVAHASDLLLDHRDLAAAAARALGLAAPRLPPRADAARVSVLDCARLTGLGWRPGGWPRLEAELPALLAAG